MKIAILGAPGAGKHDLATHIVDVEVIPTHVVIPTAEEFFKSIGRALGPEATYHEHILAHAWQQLEMERELVAHWSPVVCGTVVGIWAHIAAIYEMDVESPELVQQSMRIAYGLEVISLLMQDTFDFDRVIFLEKPVKQIIAPLDFEERVQVQIRAALDWMGVDHLMVRSDDPEMAVKVMEYLDEHPKADS